MENTQKSLYEALDNCTYILANSVEQAYKEAKEKHAGEKIDEAISESDYPEIYQTFIIDESTRDILKSYGEIVWYNEDLDLYFWWVTHFGTHWSYIMWNKYPIS